MSTVGGKVNLFRRIVFSMIAGIHACLFMFLSGLLHISEIASDRRGMDAGDKLKHNQVVFVKLLSITGNKMNLSMRGIDQITGRDTNTRATSSSLVSSVGLRAVFCGVSSVI